jgi:hypothetical protein
MYFDEGVLRALPDIESPTLISLVELLTNHWCKAELVVVVMSSIMRGATPK